jgi:hypothetical protein
MPLAVRSEDDYRRAFVCSDRLGQPIPTPPSGIDFTRGQIGIFYFQFYGAPAYAADVQYVTDDGATVTVVSTVAGGYCGGPAPMTGIVAAAVVLPPALRQLRAQPCVKPVACFGEPVP